MPDGIRRLMVRDVVSKTRDAAKMSMFAQRPDLLQAEVQGRVQRKMGLR